MSFCELLEKDATSRRKAWLRQEEWMREAVEAEKRERHLTAQVVGLEERLAFLRSENKVFKELADNRYYDWLGEWTRVESLKQQLAKLEEETETCRASLTHGVNESIATSKALSAAVIGGNFKAASSNSVAPRPADLKLIETLVAHADMWERAWDSADCDWRNAERRVKELEKYEDAAKGLSTRIENIQRESNARFQHWRKSVFRADTAERKLRKLQKYCLSSSRKWAAVIEEIGEIEREG